MTKVKNPIQSIKLLVMVNSLLLLTVIFLAFFNSSQVPGLPTTKTSQSGVLAEVQPVNAVVQTQSTPQSVANQSDELKGLPYVSRNGLAQQTAVQVVSYQRQPRVKARSSR